MIDEIPYEVKLAYWKAMACFCACLAALTVLLWAVSA